MWLQSTGHDFSSSTAVEKVLSVCIIGNLPTERPEKFFSSIIVIIQDIRKVYLCRLTIKHVILHMAVGLSPLEASRMSDS